MGFFSKEKMTPERPDAGAVQQLAAERLRLAEVSNQLTSARSEIASLRTQNEALLKAVSNPADDTQNMAARLVGQVAEPHQNFELKMVEESPGGYRRFTVATLVQAMGTPQMPLGDACLLVLASLQPEALADAAKVRWRSIPTSASPQVSALYDRLVRGSRC